MCARKRTSLSFAAKLMIETLDLNLPDASAN
jgi:hypothetical protein